MRKEINSVNCLFVEHDPDDKIQFPRWIDSGWKLLRTGVKINFDIESNPDEVLGKISTGKYHILISDLRFERGGNQVPLGLPMIQEIRNSNINIPIIALSIGDVTLLDKAIKSGADNYISKASVTEGIMKFEDLGKIILNCLHKYKYEPVPAYTGIFKIDKADYPLVALIESIGYGIILNLCRTFIEKDFKLIKPFYLRSGLSGSSVIGVSCESITPEDQPSEINNILLKISRDSDLLEDELERDTSMFPSRLFIEPYKKKVESSGVFHSISYKYESDSYTLLDWLHKEKPTQKNISELCKVLFSISQLGKVYSNLRDRSNEEPKLSLWNIINTSRSARIKLALIEEGLGALAKTYDPKNIFNEDLINNFLLPEKLIDGYKKEQFPSDHFACWSHGDLHGRNLLVIKIQSHFEAHLIDRANIDLMHWPCDISRLAVDLIVSGWDKGEKSFEWDNMNEWLSVIESLLTNRNFNKNSISEENLPILHTLIWIRKNLYSIFPNKVNHSSNEWEFRLAIAIELLRAIYRSSDLSTPKRVLGAYGACLALRLAKESFLETKISK